MNGTGVFATKDEIESMNVSLNLPRIMICGHWLESPLERAHGFALAHGLPEIAGYYGCDLRTGEFVTA